MSQAQNHALVIGVADYQHINKLPIEVINDAKAIHEVLVDPRYCAYSPNNVRLLTNEEATRDNILAAFGDLSVDADRASSVIVFFSGHGGFIPIGEHEGAYLLPVEVDSSSFPAMANSAISGEEFTECLENIPARQVLVIFDSCHAGGIGETKSAQEGVEFKVGLNENYYDKAIKSRVPGRVIFASSTETEFSYVTPGDENSLFTKHLLAGLKGGAARDDGYVRVLHLFEYLQPKVVGERSNQNPVLKCKLQTNFPIAYNDVLKSVAVPAQMEDGFEFDVYISVDPESEDADWVEDELASHLKASGIKFGITNTNRTNTGMPLISSAERAMLVSRRILLVLSDEYLQTNIAEMENSIAQFRGVEQGNWPVVPIKRQKLREKAPLRISMLSGFDFSNERRYERQMNELVEVLKSPLPKM